MSDKKYPHRIYLIGLPASGKSTFGQQFAHHINYQFFDTDTWIEQKNNYSISDIFAQKGEYFFRKQEQNALLYTKKLNHTIIATGGGMPCFFDNILKINRLGLSVFLDISPSRIAQRIEKGDTTRPHINTEKFANIENQIEKKYEERISFYRQAHLTLTADEICVQTLEERILSLNNDSK